MMFLNPEVKQRQGLLYNTEPLMQNEWKMDIEFSFGNSYKSVYGTNGMGIFLLQEMLTKDIDKGILFGYPADFIGAGIFLNTGVRRKDPGTGKRLESIQGAVNDGSKTVNTWDIPNETTCFQKYREHRDEDGNLVFNTLRIHYLAKKLAISFYDKDSNEFKAWFNLEIDLSGGWFLTFSASSGIWDEDHHIIKSIKTTNPNKVDKTHHYQDAKKMKGFKYIDSLKLVEDLIHDNRMKYKDKDDLLRLLNLEISSFVRNSDVLEKFIRKELTHSNKVLSQLDSKVDTKKISDDSVSMMRDIQMLK